MLSFLRAQQPPRTTTSHLDTITYEDGRSSQTFHPPTAEYFVTHTLPPASHPTFFAPPLHYHMTQTEYFLVRSGHARFHLSGASKVYDAGTIATIPVRAYHRFENASDAEPLVVDIRLDPHRWEMEVSFFRNFFGYVEDCRVAGVQPSSLQLLRFLHAADTPWRFRCPGRSGLGIGWIGCFWCCWGSWLGSGCWGIRGRIPSTIGRRRSDAPPGMIASNAFGNGGTQERAWACISILVLYVFVAVFPGCSCRAVCGGDIQCYPFHHIAVPQSGNWLLSAHLRAHGLWSNPKIRSSSEVLQLKTSVVHRRLWLV